MDNYLSHRWPTGPDSRPIPTLPPRPPQRKKGRVVRVLAYVFAFLLGFFIVVGAGYLCTSWLINRQGPSTADHSDPPADATPQPSHYNRHSNWTQADLPWGRPDPLVELALDSNSHKVLTARVIYERLLPSVVSVVSRQAHGYSSGSGFIVTESGYVLTNYHVIDEGTDIQVMLISDQTGYYDAKVIGFDEEYDLAVLKIEGTGLIPAPLGDSDQLSVGDPVYAIGNPMGYLYGSMTDGIVSALDRESQSTGSGLGMIQVSAPLNSGNSGGPLINAYGQVVGITSAKITGVEDDVVIEGLGLAIPMSDLLPFVNHILATGKSCRPTIGITCYVASADGQAGIMVREVQPDTPAAEAGLLPDDFILAANGQPVPSITALRRVLYRAGVDGTVTCSIIRNGRELELSFTLIDSLEE